MPGQNIQDAKRLADVSDTGLLEVKNDLLLSRYSRIASGFYDVPISLVSLVAEEHQHFPGCAGPSGELLEKAQTPLSHSFCKHVVEEGQPVVINDARTDKRTAENPAVDEYGVLSYLGIPLKSMEGNVLGSFCIIDTKPRDWTEEEILGMTDLANLVCHEIELRRLGRHLQHANEKLREEEAKNSELVHMILHDLRNPLFGISGGLSFLNESTVLTEDDRQALEICNEGCSQMELLLNQILETNKLKLTNLGLNWQAVSTEDFARPIMEQSHLAAAAKGKHFSSDISQAPETLRFDPSVIERVVQNLLVNAMKYTQAGDRIHFSVRSLPDCQAVQFEVADNGPGLSKDEACIIFESYRTGKSGRANTTSIGLGLAFCKAAVEAHGGRIWVESECGRGASFRFAIPQSSQGG